MGAAPFDLRQLMADRLSDRDGLFERHINRFTVRSARRLGTANDFVRAEGAYVYDRDGRRFTDLDAGNGVFNIGRNHPRVQSVIRDLLALETPNMVSRRIPLLAGLLAERLGAAAPAGLSKVIFTSSGSEATEAALKLARRYTGRQRFLYLEGDYHGATYGALSVTDLDITAEGFAPMLPACQRISRTDVGELSRELARGDVAGLIVELIRGVDVRPLAPDFLNQAQSLCRQHGIPLIVDEVFTGFGRTGTMFACQQMNVTPDLLILSKALSGGYVPLGALLIQEDIHDRVFDSSHVFVHGSTFEHNDLAMAVGLATLAAIEEDGLVERSAALGQLLAAGLRDLQRRHGMIADIRAHGLLIGLELKAPGQFGARLAGGMLAAKGLLAHIILTMLHEQGFLAAAVLRNNVLRLSPPLVISESDVAAFLAALDGCFERIGGLSQTIPRFVLRQMFQMARFS
jgi:acetylornithine/succinyldiaminopimelate/putrescine aminotransferase